MDADAEPTAVLAHVFLGSKAHARDRELLRRLEITHILNVSDGAGRLQRETGPEGDRKERGLTVWVIVGSR